MKRSPEDTAKWFTGRAPDSVPDRFPGYPAAVWNGPPGSEPARPRDEEAAGYWRDDPMPAAPAAGLRAALTCPPGETSGHFSFHCL